MPFRKTLVGFSGAIVATYAHILADVEFSWDDVALQLIALGFVAVGALASPIFLIWAAVDSVTRKVDVGEGFKIYVTMGLSVLLFHALGLLAKEDDKTAYLATFATVLVGILIAMAVESFKDRKKDDQAQAGS